MNSKDTKTLKKTAQKGLQPTREPNHFRRLAGIFLLSLSGFLSSNGSAQDLTSVYAQALQQDARLAAATARHQAILQARPIARSALLPQISAMAEWSHHDQQYRDVPLATQSIYNDDKYNRTRFQLELNQSLYNGEYWSELSQSRSEILQANATLKLVTQDLILRTAKAYFDLLSAKDNHRFAQAEKNAIAHQLHQARARFNLGLSTIADISESEAQFDLAQAQAIDARYQWNISKEDLQVITGTHIDHVEPLKSTIVFRAPPEEKIQRWVDKALKNNPEVQASTYRLAITEAQIKRRKAGHLPTLDLTAKYSQEDEDGGASEGINTDASVGVVLKVPLYLGGKVSAEVREARHLHREALHEHELKKRQTIRETRAAYLNVRATLARMSALKKAVKSTQTAAKAANAGYQEGIRTSVDVLLALRENFRAKRDYTKARYDFILTTLRLKQAVGTLTEQDLKQINSWLLDY